MKNNCQIVKTGFVKNASIKFNEHSFTLLAHCVSISFCMLSEKIVYYRNMSITFQDLELLNNYVSMLRSVMIRDNSDIFDFTENQLVILIYCVTFFGKKFKECHKDVDELLFILDESLNKLA